MVIAPEPSGADTAQSTPFCPAERHRLRGPEPKAGFRALPRAAITGLALSRTRFSPCKSGQLRRPHIVASVQCSTGLQLRPWHTKEADTTTAGRKLQAVLPLQKKTIYNIVNTNHETAALTQPQCS